MTLQQAFKDAQQKADEKCDTVYVCFGRTAYGGEGYFSHFGPKCEVWEDPRVKAIVGECNPKAFEPKMQMKEEPKTQCRPFTTAVR